MAKYDSKKARRIYCKTEGISFDDVFKCRGCNKIFKVKNLILHHHLPRKFFTKYWYEPWNLILLCKRCHYLTHLTNNLYTNNFKDKKKVNKNQRKLNLDTSKKYVKKLNKKIGLNNE